jgi:poly-beta-1,6-N-acetyl-D-glucosamine synthase
LQPVPYPIAIKIDSQQVRGVYRSKNISFKKILVIDKVNGGKADALNAGVNYAQGSLVACVDVDCILENDALLKMVKPFLDSKTTVIAAGGVIRIANSCIVEDGRLVEVKYPSDFLARFQVIEYFRAFLVGRMAWSRLNGLLLVSGALGLFDKKIVIEVGGYDTNTVGEDMELVVRMRKYMAQQRLDYKVVYIPDPLCWTEAPSSLKQLGNQRNRWTRGTIETMLTHWEIAFNPKYKLLGLLSFPYWLLFEWFAPLIETLGILSAVVYIFFGYIDSMFFISITLMVLSFAWALSAFAILYEELTYRQYNDRGALWKMFVTAILEPLIFHPINLYWSVRGNIDFVFGKKSWGEMNRKGFAKK